MSVFPVNGEWTAAAELMPRFFWIGAAAVFGAVLGSFVNAAVYRLPRGVSLLRKSRSFCPHCKKNLRWYHNIPLLSWLFLRGKCAYCGEPIPVRYFLVELLAAGLFAAAAYQFFGLNFEVVRAADGRPLELVFREPWIIFAVRLFLIVDLLCLAFTDLETWTIPYETTWPWIVAGLLLAPVFPQLHTSAVPWTSHARWDALIDSVQGLVVGAGSLWLVGFFCLMLINKEGMGAGDVHLMGMVGALLGWKPACLVLLLGVFIGAFTGVSVIWWGKLRRLWDQRRGPRRPVFELPEEEEHQPPPLWTEAILGGLVVLFETMLLVVYNERAGTPGYTAAVAPVSAAVGLVMGLFLLLSWPAKRHKPSPQGEIRVRDDGKKEEVLQGNYVPFGPSLALAALLVSFYDPLLRGFAGHWFLGAGCTFPYKMLGVPFGGFARLPW